MKSNFTKHDNGKPRMDLIPPLALMEIAKVMTYGAEKYEPGNFMKKGVSYGRYFAAAMRHLMQWLALEENDEETGLSHIAHAAANMIFLLSLIQHKAGKDDRFLKSLKDPEPKSEKPPMPALPYDVESYIGV